MNLAWHRWIRWAGLVLYALAPGLPPLPLPLSPKGGEGKDPAENEAIFSRATNQFDRVELFKPAEDRAGELAHTLAPLILQEVLPGVSNIAFGKITFTHREAQVDADRPTVYWYSDALLAGTNVHARMSYLWCYPHSGATNQSAVQGIRITLGLNGQPLLWETLSDTSGKDIVYATASMETNASKTVPRVEPGRRFHLELPLNDAPRLVVARVLDDGPVPMGPILYQTAKSRDIETLICRCMPAQAKTVVTNKTYTLAEFAPNRTGLEARKGRTPTSWWPGTAAGDAAIQAMLGKAGLSVEPPTRTKPQ